MSEPDSDHSILIFDQKKLCLLEVEESTSTEKQLQFTFFNVCYIHMNILLYKSNNQNAEKQTSIYVMLTKFGTATSQLIR